MKRNILLLLLLLAVVIILSATYQVFYPNKLEAVFQYMKGGLTTVTAKTPVPAELTGTLDLSQNTAYASQSFTAPQTKFKLGDFSLTNNTNEAINLKKIEIDMVIGSDLYAINNYVSNLYLVYGNTTTPVSINVFHTNYWTVNTKLAVNQTLDISVYGDINRFIPLNSVINPSMLVSGVSAATNTNIYTNSDATISGQNITFAIGSLTPGQDGSTPTSSLVSYNKRVIAGKFEFTTSADSYTISELKFIVPSYGAGLGIFPTVLDADLYDNDTKNLLTPKPAPIIFDGANYVANFNINVPIAINSSKSLTVYYDLKSNINSYTTNDNIAPILVYTKASNSKGTLTDGAASNYNNIVAYYGGIIFPPQGISVNNLYIFKSIPTFSATSSSTAGLNSSDLSLYTFSISADPSGDISVKQITFITTLNAPNKSNPHLTRFSLLKGSADYTKSVSITDVINNNFISLLSSYGIGAGIDNNVVVTFSTEEKIPAGKTQTYTLRAYADNFYNSTDSGTDSVSTYIPSDTIAVNGSDYLRAISSNIYYGLSHSLSDISVTTYNLLWSDKSSAFPNAHNDFNGGSTNDWYSGYEVLNLPLPGQVITAQ